MRLRSRPGGQLLLPLLVLLVSATFFEGYDFFAISQLLPSIRETYGLDERHGTWLIARGDHAEDKLQGLRVGTRVGLRYHLDGDIAMAITGNTVLLKHAPQCPESAEAMQQIFNEAGFPTGAYENIYATNDQIEFGNRFLFAPEIGIGARVSERMTVEASLVHLSHGQLFGGQNPGMDSLGVRLTLELP